MYASELSDISAGGNQALKITVGRQAELTRKRTRESLAHMLCEPYPTSEGKGQVNTARSVCSEILPEAKQFNPKEFRTIATPAVMEMLVDEESQHLAGLSDFIGKPISLSTENAGSPDRYDIVLM